jgi:hypothetical protein
MPAPKASGGAANDEALATWQPGTDPCGGACVTCSGGAWAGVTCSGGAAPAVTRLDLAYKDVAGDVGTLSPLRQLTYLDLANTEVAGDVRGLATLVRLTVMDLDQTKVTGQAAALTPLIRLTYLDFFETAVAGCGAFCGAGGPFHAHCDPTHGAAGCRDGFRQGCGC